MINLFKRFVAEEDGLELLEYAILAVVLVAGLLAAYQGLSDAVTSTITQVSGSLGTAGS